MNAVIKHGMFALLDAPNVRMDSNTFPDVHAVSGLLKQYLRNLPEPIVTSGLYAAFTGNSCKFFLAGQ